MLTEPLKDPFSSSLTHGSQPLAICYIAIKTNSCRHCDVTDTVTIDVVTCGCYKTYCVRNKIVQ